MENKQTLEEAAEKWNEHQTILEFGKPHNAPNRIKAFIEGAKWQQEQSTHIGELNEMVTAVEWLFKQLWEEPKDKMVWYAILDKAKEMEKEQHGRTWNDALAQVEKRTVWARAMCDFDEYYEETYKK